MGFTEETYGPEATSYLLGRVSTGPLQLAPPDHVQSIYIYIYIYIYINVSTGIRLTQVQATTADYGDRDQSASHSSKGKETSTERNSLGLRLLSHLDGCCIP